MKIEIESIGSVSAKRADVEDDLWGGTVSQIELDDRFDEDSLAGLDAFSHVEITFFFDRADPSRIVTGARHPRNNPAWPRVGIFAQRAKNRPNRLGSTICRLLGVSGRTLRVEELDAIDGTPVVDIKPVLREFLPKGDVEQPGWCSELMERYWQPDSGPRTEK